MIEVIAEIGVNHNGDVATAYKLIDAAKASGCHVAKFQLWNTERVYPRERWDEMKQLELSRHQMQACARYCNEVANIEFMCTPDEIGDAEFLREIGVKRMKTSSQDVTNKDFIRRIAKLNLPTILSTGACEHTEMDAAVVEFWSNSSQPLTVLHCVSAYPAPIWEMNLRVLKYMQRTYRNIGLSDHTLGLEAAPLALACGATVFEKHITLDKFQKGPDHRCSCTPQEMTDYVAAIYRANKILGDGEKKVMPSEIENRKRYEDFIKTRLENLRKEMS